MKFCMIRLKAPLLGASHLIPRGGPGFDRFSVGGGVLFFFLLRVEYFFFFLK